MEIYHNNSEPVEPRLANPAFFEKKPLNSGEESPGSEKGASGHNSGTIGVDIADRFDGTKLGEKFQALIGSVLVVSGLKSMVKGIRDKDKDEFLKGSKTTFWGAYHSLNTIEKLFKASLSVTPGLRVLGGTINSAIAFSSLKKDYSDNNKIDSEKALFNAGAAAWGLRHVAMGLDGLAKSSLMAKCAPAVKDVLTRMPIFGAVGAAMGVAGGVLDAAFGAKNLIEGIKTDDKEKQILGGIDIGVGLAMGASAVLSGPVGIAMLGIASTGIGYRFWRTDKEMIKKYAKIAGEKIKNAGKAIKEKVKEVFNGKETGIQKESLT